MPFYENKHNLKKIKLRFIFSGVFSHFLEYYDFYIFPAYIFIFSKYYFPIQDISNLYKTLLMFGAAFFARILGAVFFGFIGDIYGRKNALLLSILLMAFSTICIGCLPTYEHIGFIAPLLLLFFRLLQGFSLGGESSGALVFILEQQSILKKNLVGSIILTSGTFGMIFALTIVYILREMPEWTWRISFCLGGSIALFGLYVRLKLPESYEINFDNNKVLFKQYRKLSEHKSAFFRAIGLGTVNSSLVYTLTVFLKLYISMYATIDSQDSFHVVVIGLTLILFLVPFTGYLTDYFKPKKIISYAFYLMLAASFIIPFCLIKQHFIIVSLLLTFLIALINAPTPVFLNSLFPKEIRCFGVSVSFSLGIALGAQIPLLLMLCIRYLQTPYAFSIIFLFLSIISLLSIWNNKRIKNVL